MKRRDTREAAVGRDLRSGYWGEMEVEMKREG